LIPVIFGSLSDNEHHYTPCPVTIAGIHCPGDRADSFVDVRNWLKADLQPPEIDFRFAPESRRFPELG
jgi:hypothetical protein